jgi:putative transposase
LPKLLKKLELSKNSYYYQEARFRRNDKYRDQSFQIVQLFHNNKERYGYRRVHGMLKKNGITVSEKVVRWIMIEGNMVVKIKRKRKYSSYQGEISPSVRMYSQPCKW